MVEEQHEEHGMLEDFITPHVKVGARALVPEVLLTAILLTFGVVINHLPVRPISFIEGDSQLSHPLLPETVPAGRLFELSLFWPAVVLACVTMATRGVSHPALRTLGWLELGLLQAFGLGLATSCTLKIVTARHRPNFFASCNYLGFRDAQASGDFREYLSRITPGSLADLKNCWAMTGAKHLPHEPLLMRQAMQGFPSSHAVLCFAAGGFLAAATRALFRLRGGQWFSWRSAFACSPLVIAAWVGVTRIRDRYHTEGDVATGASLGLLCASLAWSHFSAFPGRNELALKIAALPEPAAPGAFDWVGEEMPETTGAEGQPHAEAQQGQGQGQAGTSKAGGMSQAQAGDPAGGSGTPTQLESAQAASAGQEKEGMEAGGHEDHRPKSAHGQAARPVSHKAVTTTSHGKSRRRSGSPGSLG